MKPRLKPIIQDKTTRLLTGGLLLLLLLSACSADSDGSSTEDNADGNSESTDEVLGSDGSNIGSGSISGTVVGSDGDGSASDGSLATGGSQATGGASSGGSSSGGSNAVTPGEFVPCIIDVSNVGAACSGSDPSSCDGADIAQNYTLWPDPYECYVCGPGVTLLKGSACDNANISLVWNDQSEQCILNGQGYPMGASHTCSSGRYASNVSPEAYSTLVSQWYEIATVKGKPVNQPNAGADAYIVDLSLEDGTKVQAALSMGHGVLDGKCGDTFLVKVGDKYVLLLQTDIRAWSLELSPGANTWLDQSNVGGTCIIPDVRRIDSAFVVEQFK